MPKMYDCQIIGSGPAGMCMLVALENEIAKASSAKSKAKLRALQKNLIMLEADTQPGGQLGRYCINANTDALEIVSGIADNTAFSAIRNDYLKHIKADQTLISLREVHDLVLEPLADKVQQLLGDRLLLNSGVVLINKDEQGFHCIDQTGKLLASSRHLVIACGGSEPILPQLLAFQEKTMVATQFLKLESVDQLPCVDGDIVIIGASHSGFSCAWRLLNDPLFKGMFNRESKGFGKGAGKARKIQICHRGQTIKMRANREFAAMQQMPYQDPEDVCVDTELVYRHAGLRKDAKNLYLEINNQREPRAELVTISNIENEHKRLESAGLIIQCCGFSANFPPLNIDGKATELAMQSDQGKLHRTSDGKVIDGLFGIGLGVNTIPAAEFRGEASFTGSVNSLQIYPMLSAVDIIEQILQD